MIFIYRFCRSIRSGCAPIAAVIGFSCLLTFIFILYQPTFGPGLSQRLSWQSWDVISSNNALASSNSNSNNNDAAQSSPDLPEGVDWWNVTTTQDTVDSVSLPLDVWAPLLPHDTGLSEISVVRCLVRPDVAGDLCTPDTTPEKDSIKGNWVRVEKNLNYENGYWSGYLHLFYRRTRRQDVNLITNIRLLPPHEEPAPIDSWTKVETSLRGGVYGVPPLYLWYQTGKTASEMSAEEKSQIITELDLHFGNDDPWYGFHKLRPPTTIAEEGKKENAFLVYRRGVHIPPRAPPLHFDRDGKFKIMQIADLHYSVNIGECRDVRFSPCTGSDNLTNSLLGRVLDIEKPDLVVFTGDQLNGQGTSWDPKSVLAKFAKAVTERQIPWAAVFGNHDSENGLGRMEQMKLMQALPYSVVEPGPKDVTGVGNYVLKVKSADPSKTHLLTLYFLDSGSYSDGQWTFWGQWKPTALDWIRQDQIDWFLQESASIRPIERPFTPDGAKDLSGLWTRQSDQMTPQTRKLGKPNAMMFFHIPLQEAYANPDIDPATKRPYDIGLKGNERPGAAKGNDGFYDKAVLAAMESDHVTQSAQGGQPREVKVIANGHCHITENCRRVRGVWNCFGGGGSYSGYGKVGFDRRFRIFQVEDYGETIRTWKRTEQESVTSEQVLTGRGAPSL
ncbi:Phosphatase dcr2 [Stygiomarasmius scandens]|uniref:Phosphatase dcr2 n=1 Tax=Marasmiellus scandens TaxID=2682957 RepID=A0ABR1JXZ8_9AGAR